jgi:hypothetical protein
VGRQIAFNTALLAAIGMEGWACIPGTLQGDHLQIESYLLELARYVVLNPVRTRLTHTPDQWYGVVIAL